MTPPPSDNKTDQRAQPAGMPVPAPAGGALAAGPDRRALELHARLIELVPDAAERAKLLKVPPAVEAGWQEGKLMPVLRAQSRLIETTVAKLERKP